MENRPQKVRIRLEELIEEGARLTKGGASATDLYAWKMIARMAIRNLSPASPSANLEGMVGILRTLVAELDEVEPTRLSGLHHPLWSIERDTERALSS